jgi:hypothetical protein
MVLVADPGRREPASEQTASPSVPLVEALREGVLQEVHAGRHVRAGRVDEEVEVVAHRAAGVDAPVVSCRGGRDELSEVVVVNSGGEEELASGGAAGDVVEAVREARP